jgi:hypothetical protein
MAVIYGSIGGYDEKIYCDRSCTPGRDYSIV